MDSDLNPAATAPATHPRRILVADDEHLVALELARLLRDGGYTVIGPFGDGEAAVASNGAGLPDLAVLDIRMPRMDGLAAAKQLLSKHGVPTVIVSAHSDPALVDQAQESGVFGYVVKPFTDAQLRAAIEVAWARFEEARAAKKRAEDLQRRLDERRVIEQAKWILVDRKAITEHDAMQSLQRHARSTRRKIIEVAQQVIDANELM